MRETRSGVMLEDGPILVTGAAGFVGAHLMDELNMREGDAAADVTATFPAPPGVKTVSWRLPEPAAPDLGGFRTIVHLAARSSVQGSRLDLRDVYAVNLMGTIELLCLAQERCPGARILLASSSEVYARSGQRLLETSPMCPGSPYAASKAAMEQAATHFVKEKGLAIVTARSFPHYGPGQADRFALASFCRRIVEAERSGTTVLKTGNLFPVRDYLHVRDVVRAYAVLLARGYPGEVYNVCSGIGVSMGELLDVLIRVSGASLAVVTDPLLAREVDHDRQIGDPGKLLALGGFIPEIGHEEGLSDLYSWWSRRIP